MTSTTTFPWWSCHSPDSRPSGDRLAGHTAGTRRPTGPEHGRSIRIRRGETARKKPSHWLKAGGRCRLAWPIRIRTLRDSPWLGPSASVAQLAEQLICNQQVAGSTPAASSARPDGRRQPRGRRRPTGRDTPGPKQTRKTITETRQTTRQTLRPGAASTARHEPLDSRTTHHKKPHEGDHGRHHPPATSQQRILPPPRASRGQPADRPSGPGQEGSFPSGQRGQTVNLMAYAFAGSNPALPIFHRGVPLLPRSVQAQAVRGAAGRQPRPSQGPCGHGGLAGEGPEATQTACGCSSMVEQ